MIEGKRVLALIPARGGSKGIKDKNITPLCGSSLLEKVLRICAFFHVNHISTNPLLS